MNFDPETRNSKPIRITVLGAGRVGAAIVRDLARETNFRVTAVDARRKALERLVQEAPVAVAQADLQEPAQVAEVVAGAELVICAVPGFMGFRTLQAVIEAGKNVVDISFFPEDPFTLDGLARARGVTAVVDCGVAPGLSNILAGHAAARLDRLERFTCYVGGLPKERRWPFEYKAVFSPLDVLEEYTRPARFVAHGEVVTLPALSDVELLNFPGTGTLEAFNTDGLRTLLRTLDAPFMREKTLRDPGHAALMRVFRESGFFRTDPIEVNGQPVRPLNVTA
ncbi:MAG: saccharopine dehydrogenase family protein, partial [Anaerolineae bacterium]